jgi:hypothetical protein
MEGGGNVYINITFLSVLVVLPFRRLHLPYKAVFSLYFINIEEGIDLLETGWAGASQEDKGIF